MVRWITILLIFFIFMEEKAQAAVHTDQPYTYEVMENDLSTLKSKYHELIQIKSIGLSHFGRKLYAIQLGSGKKNVLLIGTHHGREWLTSMLLMKMLDTYAAAYQNHLPIGSYPSDILNDVSIWFVPMLNPDGVAIQQNQIRSFPTDYQKRLIFMNEGKDDFIRWKANGMGVDLNRQYPAGWENMQSGPEQPYYQFYKGKKPLEATETVAITNFVHQINPSIALAYHTAGREIYWRYKNGIHLIRDYLLAKKVSKLTGYPLAKPAKTATGGGFTDWFIPTYHRPAMTIEISYIVGERNPPLSVFKEEWKRNQYVGIKMAEDAK